MQAKLVDRCAGEENELSKRPKRPGLLVHLAASCDQHPPAASSPDYGQHVAESARATAQHADSQPSAVAEQCPICSEHLPAELLSAHIEQELSILADENETTCSVPKLNAEAVAPERCRRPGPLQPLRCPLQKPVRPSNAVTAAKCSHQQNKVRDIHDCPHG